MTDEKVLSDQTVIVERGRITAFGASGAIAVPPGATTIDGRGRYLMPGLVDFHTHPGGREELISYLLHGQTTIATLGGEALELRAGLGSGASPNLISTGVTLDGSPPINRRFQAVRGPDEAALVVARQKALGADLVKIYALMPPATLRAVTAAAHALGLPVAGHIPREADEELALASLDLVAHGEEYFKFIMPDADEAKLRRLAELTARHGTAVIPNLVAYVAMPRHAAQLAAELGDPDTAFLTGSIYHEFLPQNNRYATRADIPGFVENAGIGLDVLKRLTAELHRSGVLLLAGTDAPIFCFPGRCLIEELQLMHESGLSNFEALETATANPGRFWQEAMHRQERFGTIEVGARADLLLLSENPLDNLAALEAPEGVVVSGAWWPQAELERQREASRPELAQAHADVEEYERLLAAADFAAIEELFATMTPGDDKLSANAIIFDALELEEAGSRAEAIRLLRAAADVLPRSFGLRNVEARMRADAGDALGAAAAYRQSLRIEPLNGVALDGLSNTAE